MPTVRPVATAIACTLLQACAAITPSDNASSGTTFYDSMVYDDQGQSIDIVSLADALSEADVVVVGELHGHQGAHLLQARLQAALYQRHPDQILAMEAFNLDHQEPLDRYLAGESGEEEMMKDAAAWDNYQAAYRPLVEFARRHDLPVVAANAPAGVVRCVGRQGANYLEQLPDRERGQLPRQPFPEIAGYRERFMDTLGSNAHGQESEEGRRRLENTYLAQLLRDSTMADRILRMLDTHPDHQVIMITGTFHSENRQGLVAVLDERAPGLTVRVLTPNTLPDTDEDNTGRGPRIATGDYRYDLWPMPVPYRDQARERAAMMERFGKARQIECR